MPIAKPSDVKPKTGTGYPEPYKSRVLPREVRQLGEACGLTKIGVNLTTLEPGKESSMRHWHTYEDEFVYIVDGEVVLRTDEGEQVMRTGMAAGFPAGDKNGHQLINRTDRTAVYLVVSNRDERDGAEYSDADVDLAYRGGKMVRRDGSPI